MYALVLGLVLVAAVLLAAILAEDGVFETTPAVVNLGICGLLLLGSAARHVVLPAPRSAGLPVLVQVAGLASWGVRFRLRRMPVAASIGAIVIGVVVAGVSGYLVIEEIPPNWWEDQILTLAIEGVTAARLVASGMSDLLTGARRGAIELTPHHVVLRLDRHPVMLEVAGPPWRPRRAVAGPRPVAPGRHRGRLVARRDRHGDDGPAGRRAHAGLPRAPVLRAVPGGQARLASGAAVRRLDDRQLRW